MVMIFRCPEFNGTRCQPASLRKCSWSILYGMGFHTASAPWLLSDRDRTLAREKINETALHAKALAASLPGNRELLAKVRRFGLQKI